MLPGPVTILLPRKDAPNDPLSQHLNPGVADIGIRVPDCLVVTRLTEALAEAADESDTVSGLPLVLTSANLSGQTSTLCPEEFKPLWPSLDLVIDGGMIKDSDDRAGSTIVNLSSAVRVPGSKHYSVVREGRWVSFLYDFEIK